MKGGKIMNKTKRIGLIQIILLVVLCAPLFAFSFSNQINPLNSTDQTWLKIVSPKGASVVHGTIEVKIQSTKVVELSKVEVLLNNDLTHTFSSPTESENDIPTYKFNWDTTSIYQGGGCLIARGYNDKNESNDTGCVPIMIRNDHPPV